MKELKRPQVDEADYASIVSHIDLSTVLITPLPSL